MRILGLIGFCLIAGSTLERAAWACEPQERQAIQEASRLQQHGNPAEAERRLRALVEALERAGAAPGGATCLAVVLNNLGAINQDLGRYQEAERLYLRALQLEQQRQSGSAADADADSDTAATLNNLGSVYFESGQYRKAETARRQAIDVRIARFGPKHPSVARIVQNLAAQKYTQGQFREATELYERAMDIWRTSGLEDTPDCATALQGVGLVCSRNGDLAAGVRNMEAALDIWTRTGVVTAAVARAEANLAVLKLAQAQTAAAERHWRSAISKAEHVTGPHSLTTLDVLNGYLTFLSRVRRRSEARAVKSRIRTIKRTTEAHPPRSSIIDISELGKPAKRH